MTSHPFDTVIPEYPGAPRPPGPRAYRPRHHGPDTLFPIEALQLEWSTWSEMCEFVNVGELLHGQPSGCYLDEEGHASSEFHNLPDYNLGLAIPGGLRLPLIAKEHDWVTKDSHGFISKLDPEHFAEWFVEHP